MRSFLLSTLGILVLVSTASAGQDKPTEAWAGGVLLRVNAAAGTIDVRQGEHEQTYAIAPDAQLIKDKKPLQVADLDGGIGHQVTIRYATAGDDRVASRVTVLARRNAPAAAAKAAAAPASEPTSPR